MFTRVHFKNFRSFKDIELNLESKKKQCKPLVMIYGENGMGKTNISIGFSVLGDLLRTMDLRDMMEQFLADETFKKVAEITGDPQVLLQRVFKESLDVKHIVQTARMADCNDPVVLEYEFSLHGKIGRYLVELGEDEVIHERLEYTLEKNKGLYFDLSANTKKINPKIFENQDILRDVRNLVDRFWGKHTFLAILLHEKNDKSERYITSSISKNFRAIIDEFCNLSCYIKPGEEEREMRSGRLHMLASFKEGHISKSKEKILDATESVLSNLFSSINSDNHRVFYQRKDVGNNQIRYKLMICKYIAGQERIIDFEQESTGNHQLLRILRHLLFAISGGTAIVDEIDTGIHDLLMKKIIEDALPYIKGQLIVTTHNTALMEISNIQTYTYIISEDANANKTIRCIDDYENRTYQLNNVRDKYFSDAYDGIPHLSKIDFVSMLNTLEQ